ncbi:ABC-three component system middle component 2 [Microvirga mediterraneensis]|uniref:Threonine transporter n=1 Tax=Microvirga mediterraneensis TaxID=2754695 RepID=A0A838BUI0_9HYPH|nr:ABC-three component system middle component 2 [Microvirga mediterraneensis]MBA1159008.1 threonine transporter [Microvirga mediterraneensis]
MDEVAGPRSALTFNGPLEAGVRLVAILGAAFPQAFDIERLTAYDYLLVHTQQLGGPADLHPPAPIQAPMTEVRRKVIQSALMLMMTRDLVTRDVQTTGIRYRAGETASLFLDSLQSSYLRELKMRASWLVRYLEGFNDVQFRALMDELFESWVVEFQAVERSLGAEQ